MCGIFGIIGKINKENVNVEKSLSAINHRGPDDCGIYQDEKLALGFKRLSIIDLSLQGHQPMTNENSTVWIILNGEIYNYQELRKELSFKHKFISKTDTEVLIHGYEEWGIDKLLKKINGMFAFCLYDKNKQTAYLARDRIGEKPLYYYKNSNYLAFASEAKALFKLDNFVFKLDEEMLNLWMGFPYLPDNNKTIIKNINKIPPASYLEIDLKSNDAKIKSYWNIPNNNITIDFPEAVEKLEKLLIDSVTKRLTADVPVGILLSGGLDSSLITAIASKYSSKKIRTITISFQNSSIDECKYAKLTAKHCGVENINIHLAVKDIYSQFKKNIWLFDDLSTIDGGMFSTFLLSQKIGEMGIKVILTGEGADEVFGGYSWFQLSQYPFRLLPNKIKSQLYYYAIMRSLPNGNFFKYSNYLNKKLQEINDTFLKKIQHYEVFYSLPNHYCLKLDKGTSAASCEARNPYLDHRIIELACGIPDKFILNSNFVNFKASNEKFIIRKIAEKYLPKEITNRKKRGGMLPIYHLLENGLKQDKNLILNNHYLTNFFGRKYLEKLIMSQPNNRLFIWQKEWILWKCLIFSLWYDYYKQYK